MLGPFANPDDSGLYEQHVPEEEVAPQPRALAGRRQWKAVWNLTDGVDLNWATGPGDGKLAYAFTYLRAAADWAGREVLIVVECANGGRTKWWAEDLYLDEIAVLTH